ISSSASRPGSTSSTISGSRREPTLSVVPAKTGDPVNTDRIIIVDIAGNALEYWVPVFAGTTPREPMTQRKNLDFATRCVHAGQEPDPTTGAVMMPIYATSTYVQQSPGVNKGYDYARTKNPTRMAFERCVADLESGRQAFAFASGLSAIATTL